MSDAVHGTIASVSAPIAQPDAKALHIETGVAAVDMEPRIVANVAVTHGLPMVAVRVIIDLEEHALPRAAVVSLCSNGAVDIAALMRSAIGCPAEFPDLLRTALYALLAGAALVHRRRILRSHVALADSGEETLSVEDALRSSLEVNTPCRKVFGTRLDDGRHL